MNLIIVLTLSSVQPFNKLTSHLTCSDSVHYLPRFLCTAISLSGVNLYCVLGIYPSPISNGREIHISESTQILLSTKHGPWTVIPYLS